MLIEMSCLECNKILLMEPLATNWCCVMNPLSKEIGFVPSYCVNQTSFSIGIVLEDKSSLISQADGIKVKVGDFLGILENNPNDKLLNFWVSHFLRGNIQKFKVKKFSKSDYGRKF